MDIPILQYSTLLNAYESLNITKLDVLDQLDTIKIGIHYKLNGKRLPIGFIPSTPDILSQIEVEYEGIFLFTFII